VQTRDERGQKMPRNANIICESSLTVICAVGLHPSCPYSNGQSFIFQANAVWIDLIISWKDIKIEMLLQIGFQLIVMPHTTTHVL